MRFGRRRWVPPHMADTDTTDIREEFGEAVNMTPKELRDWLRTDESRSVGDTGGDAESTGGTR